MHNNNYSKADASCNTYIDDIRVYEPRSLSMAGPKTPLPVNGIAKMQLSKYIYGFDPDIVEVQANGAPVEIEEVVFDAASPRVIGLRFAPGVLQKDTVYTVTLNGGGIFDAVGETQSAAAGFTISSLDPITALQVSAEGTLNQDLQQLGEVVFTARPTPDKNIDESEIV